MMNRNTFLGLGLAALLLPTTAVFAADHIDSPSAVAEPAADITDLYAWMSPDASKVNLIMDVTPFATTESSFSDAVQYVFHVNSSSGYGESQTETLIICQFESNGAVECWAGDKEYVKGDASAEAGLRSESGDLRVFAGLRNDPFFMEFNGFTTAVDTVISAAPSLSFDGEGCPILNQATSDLLIGQLTHGTDGAPASDTFAGSNVLSLVVQVDKELLTGGGPLLGVWASTHSR
jgi:hypothetical protein